MRKREAILTLLRSENREHDIIKTMSKLCNKNCVTLVRRHNFTPLTGCIGTIVPKLILWEICCCRYNF